MTLCHTLVGFLISFVYISLNCVFLREEDELPTRPPPPSTACVFWQTFFQCTLSIYRCVHFRLREIRFNDMGCTNQLDYGRTQTPPHHHYNYTFVSSISNFLLLYILFITPFSFFLCHKGKTHNIFLFPSPKTFLVHIFFLSGSGGFALPPLSGPTNIFYKITR